LNENDEFGEGDQRMLEIIHQHTLRINHIIEDILTISRGSETVKEHIDLGSWLPAFIDRFSESGLASADTFKLKIEVENTNLQFDAGHLSQILTNLCTNAYPLCIEIADQGPGIDSEILDQIFEPFYTTSHQGSGLGLYIVGQLCELNNAFISAKINQNNGTSFILQMTSLAIDPERQTDK
jgi:two-component system sensor histidine kinase PilS (NtrC family)